MTLRKHTGVARADRVSPTTIALAIVVGGSLIALRLWVFEPVSVASDSMEPTVMQGETAIISRILPPSDEALIGRLVTVERPGGDVVLLKRAVAGGGQVLAIRDGALYVDGEMVAEPYVDHTQTDGTFFRRVVVPEGSVFVLGDNRAVSVDSREFGFISLDRVTGLVLWAG